MFIRRLFTAVQRGVKIKAEIRVFWVEVGGACLAGQADNRYQAHFQRFNRTMRVHLQAGGQCYRHVLPGVRQIEVLRAG